MSDLTVTILLLTAFFVLFALLCVGVQYQELEKRFRILAKSQAHLAESQTDLAESQIALTESFKELNKEFQDLVKEHKTLREKYELVAKAQQQQAITNLQRQLFTLVSGNREIANRLIDLEKTTNPGRSEAWYLKKVIFDLQRDEYERRPDPTRPQTVAKPAPADPAANH